MGTQLNKKAYQKLIDENISELEKHMPEHSLEKKHTIEVLKWSVKEIYEKNKKFFIIRRYNSGTDADTTDIIGLTTDEEYAKSQQSVFCDYEEVKLIM